MKRRFLTGLLFVMTGFFLTHAAECCDVVRKGLTLWYQQVLPSLFPFLTAMSLFSAWGVPRLLGKWLRRPLGRCFGLSGEAVFPLFLGHLAGFPAGGAALELLYEERLISKPEAQRLFCFCHAPSPAFCIAVSGAAVFGSTSVGVQLFFCQLCANILPLALLRFFPVARPIFAQSQTERPLFSAALLSAAETMVVVAGCMMLFPLFPLLLRSLSLLPENPTFASSCLEGFFELTTGLFALQRLALPHPIKMAAVSLLMAFGGLSAQMQIRSTQKTLPCPPFYVPALLTKCLLAALLAFLCGQLFPL